MVARPGSSDLVEMITNAFIPARASSVVGAPGGAAPAGPQKTAGSQKSKKKRQAKRRHLRGQDASNQQLLGGFRQDNPEFARQIAASPTLQFLFQSQPRLFGIPVRTPAQKIATRQRGKFRRQAQRRRAPGNMAQLLQQLLGGLGGGGGGAGPDGGGGGAF